MKKTIHIVVKDGLVQEVYADNGLDVQVVLYDLDCENDEELEETETAVAQLQDIGKKVY